MASHGYFASHPQSLDQQQQQHLLSPPPTFPGHASPQSSAPSSPNPSYTSDRATDYKHQSLVDFDELRKAHEQDSALKTRIRRLRALSRFLSLILSIAVFIPIALTLHKYLSTRGTFLSVTQPDGTTIERNAWHKDTKLWPTEMYFGTAGISVVLNLAIILAYRWGIDKANRAATVATVFSWATVLGNVVVWCVAVALYRLEKDKGGISDDLWGWTCSPAARAIQHRFRDQVDFNAYCNVQSVSWYIGLAQAGASVLTVVIYAYVLVRMSGKKKMKKRYSQLAGQYPTNY